MGFCSVAAKFLVGTFALFFCVLGAATASIGGFALSEANTFLSGAVPPEGPWFLIGAGIGLLFVGVAGFASACCSSRPCLAKCSLGLMAMLILVAFILSLCASVFSFAYSEVMGAAVSHGFSDETMSGVVGDIQKTVYSGIRGSFEGSFAQCQPTGYSTTDIHNVCLAQNSSALSNQVTDCASSSYPTGFSGIFCKEGPGFTSPFAIDQAVAFEDPTSQFSFGDVLGWRSFGTLVNYACATTTATFAAQQAIVASVTASKEPTEITSIDTFSSCYASTWWGNYPPEEPSNGGAMENNPVTQQPLTAEQQDFFNDLDLVQLPLSPKRVFCMCAEVGQNSEIWNLLQTLGGWAQWIGLGLTIFLFFTFIAACYLLCCKREVVSELTTGKKHKNAANAYMIRP